MYRICMNTLNHTFNLNNEKILKFVSKIGNPILSFDKAEQKKNWEKIAETCEEGSIVQGRVRSIVKGGLIVSI